MILKKWAALLLAALLALSLTACQDDRHVSGALVEVQTAEDGSLSALILERDGKRTGVKLAEKTHLWPVGEGSWTSEELLAEFQKDLQPGNEVNARCYSRRETLETKDGERIPAYWGLSVSITGILEREVLTLRDGTAVDVMENGIFDSNHTYQLPDGTGLLRVVNTGGPENHYVAGVEIFDGLSEAAKERVRAYYEEQGALYDEEEELEKSYAAYLRLGENFSCDQIQQDVTACASSERVTYFLTCLTLPQEYGGRLCYERKLGAAFDRETGEKIGNWDLFGVPEQEVRRRLPELCGWEEDPGVREAMSRALDPDWIVFFPDHVAVDFPPGSLPGEEYGHIISVDYKDAPEGFFQPWAVPVSREE